MREAVRSQESITEEVTRFQESFEELVRRYEDHKGEQEGKMTLTEKKLDQLTQIIDNLEVE